MRINKDKNIGRVLFIVEGGRTEFSLLRRVFCNVLSYNYLEKPRQRQGVWRFKNPRNRHSTVTVVNTEESHISYVSDPNGYLNALFELLIEKYQFPVDKAAIYYLFDRDPFSNTDTQEIISLLNSLKNPYENEGYGPAGLLLLSYPSIEAYILSSFSSSTPGKMFTSGKELKEHLASQERDHQLNKLNEESIANAAGQMMLCLASDEVGLGNDIDWHNFGDANLQIFQKQESLFDSKQQYQLLCLLSIAFIQLGIIEPVP